MLQLSAAKGEHMEAKLYKGEARDKAHSRAADKINTTRQQELDEEFTAFVKKYVVAENADNVVYNHNQIEDDFGLEPGSLPQLVTQLGTLYTKDVPGPKLCGFIMLGILYGLWSGDTRYTHIETREMAI